ncbi:MAG TPA: DinB family protein [Bryobacteraceae bacterium]|nr:DinB family protein [Bryobacteraceae bacterium]
MKKLAGLAIFALFAGFASAQSDNSLVDILVKHWQTSKDFTLAVADKMPDNEYSYKATPIEMSFGEMVSHIGDANINYCSVALGEKPQAKGTDFSKAGAEKHLTDSFDFCITGLKKMSNEDLKKMVGKAPRQSTAFEALWGAFTHTAHHRAQLEVYLRLKGIAPPNYKF